MLKIPMMNVDNYYLCYLFVIHHSIALTISMALNDNKHIMLSYNWNSKNLISQVYKILQEEQILVWLDTEGGMKDDIYDR